MADIRIDEKVINKKYGTGSIVSFERGIITVKFQDCSIDFLQDAFEKGFLKYENPAVQEVLNEARQQKEEKAAQILAAQEKSAAERRKIQAELSKAHRRITVLSATFRLDPAPITLTGVRKKDQALIQQIFSECDQQTQVLMDSWNPQMEYLDRTSCSISKYCVSFLSKHCDTYVFRLFSRNDQYRKDAQKNITVTNSNTSEVLRVLQANGKVYFFSKNLTSAGQYLVNTKRFANWHVSNLTNAIMVNQVIRNCDCNYLNDYISGINIDCMQYLNLLIPALYKSNNKAEILFKHQMFAPAHRIDNLEAYLEKYTHKQITVACANKALNTLPLMVKFGNLEPETLQKLESVMRKRKDGRCIRSILEGHLSRLDFDISNLDRRLVNFLKKQEHFLSAIYEDYINMLADEPGITPDDFFDKDYLNRHWELREIRSVYHYQCDAVAYAQVAQELSWINREENDYFIILPKTVEDFRYEGSFQHHCVHSMKYYNEVTQRNSIIVFLRKEKHTPFVTIEYDYDTFEVVQAFGKYDSPIPPELYEYIVNLGKRLNYEMRSHQ